MNFQPLLNIKNGNVLNDTEKIYQYVGIEAASFVQFRTNGLVMTYHDAIDLTLMMTEEQRFRKAHTNIFPSTK